MEDIIYKLLILVSIKKAIDSTFSGLQDCNTYHDCMEMINEIEKRIIFDLEKNYFGKNNDSEF